MSDPIIIPHDQTQRRGSWFFIGAAVFIRCPMCGKISVLRDAPDWPKRADGTNGHHIAGNGAVSPSIVCPRCGEGWHVYGTLQDWTG